MRRPFSLVGLCLVLCASGAKEPPQYELNGQLGRFEYVIHKEIPAEADWKQLEELREKFLEKYGEPSTEEGRSDSFENFREAVGKLSEQHAQVITGAEYWDFSVP